MIVQDRRVKLIILTFGHLSRSSRLESSFHGEPLTPAVGSAAANVEILLHPSGESPVTIRKVVAGTLSAEPCTKVVEERRQILLRRLLVLLPDRLDCSFEFVLVQVDVFGVGRRWLSRDCARFIICKKT
jgi:hypothetical protein